MDAALQAVTTGQRFRVQEALAFDSVSGLHGRLQEQVEPSLCNPSMGMGMRTGRRVSHLRGGSSASAQHFDFRGKGSVRVAASQLLSGIEYTACVWLRPHAPSNGRSGLAGGHHARGAGPPQQRGGWCGGGVAQARTGHRRGLRAGQSRRRSSGDARVLGGGHQL